MFDLSTSSALSGVALTFFLGGLPRPRPVEAFFSPEAAAFFTTGVASRGFLAARGDTVCTTDGAGVPRVADRVLRPPSGVSFRSLMIASASLLVLSATDNPDDPRGLRPGFDGGVLSTDS